MKKTFLLLCALFLAFSTQAQSPLRLMTYNIRNANGMDGKCDYQRIANVINNACADVVAVQEVDSMTGRSGQKYVLGEIAARTQMHAFFAPAINYDGGKYGIGMLTRKQPLSIRTIALPGREEARAALVAEFEDYIYACTHLSLTEEDRMKSLDLIKSLAADADKPFFLAGDMNAEPTSDFIKGLQKDFQIISDISHPTCPSPEPKETIDYIVIWKKTAKGVKPTATQIIDERVASDHRPVTVDIRLKTKKKASSK